MASGCSSYYIYTHLITLFCVLEPHATEINHNSATVTIAVISTIVVLVVVVAVLLAAALTVFLRAKQKTGKRRRRRSYMRIKHKDLS